MSPVLEWNHPPRHCWDLVGIDGLQVARSLFGHAISQIAPFQSIETRHDTCDCSVLRLCEGNFRIVAQSMNPDAVLPLTQRLQEVQTQSRVWVKQLDWLSAIVIPESLGLTLLPQLAVPKPPYRLQGMAIDRAVPARIETLSVLIWRHAIAGQPGFELHTATKDRETIKNCLGLSPHPPDYGLERREVDRGNA